MLCALLNLGARDWDKPKCPGCKAFHGCYVQRQSIVSKHCNNLLDCLSFLCEVGTFIFSWMNKFTSWQRSFGSFNLFYYLWAKRNVVVPHISRVKDLLVWIKFLLLPDNWTEVLLHPMCLHRDQYLKRKKGKGYL